MSAYGYLAGFYDELTQDVDYKAFADFYQELICREGIPETVLDLACGTGRLTRILASQGYRMVGVDASSQMLSEAAGEQGDILYIQQELRELEIIGQVDAAISSLDSMNYIPPEDMGEVLRRVFTSLAPGGVFAFDINTVEKLTELDGELFCDERDDILCLWSCEYDDEKRACYYDFDLFIRRGDLWQRESESHVEYVYEVGELVDLLGAAGFSNFKITGELHKGPPEKGEQRIFISAVKPKGDA